MKICIISGYPPNIGRGAELCSSFVDALSKHQDVSKILVLGNKAVNVPYRTEQGKVVVIRAWAPDSWRSLLEISKALTHTDFDVAHINYGYLFPGKPLFSSIFIVFTLLIMKCLRRPSLVMINQVFSQSEIDENREVFAPKIPSIFAKIGFIALNKAIGRLCYTVVAIHRKHEETLRENYGIKNVEYVPLFGPIDSLDFGKNLRADSKQRLGLRGKKVLLVFGFIVPFKGIEYAVQSMPKVIDKFPETVLIVAGSIPPSLSHSKEAVRYVDRITSLIKDLGVEKHVIFQNKYASESEAKLLFSACDILVLPNVKQSGPSEILRKAMVCRIPVIATNVGFNKYDIKDRVNGILVSPADSEGLAKAVTDLLSDEEEYLSISQHLFEAGKEYSVDNALRRMVELYKMMPN